MNKKISKWTALAAMLMFAAATFQIVSDQFILGAIFFGAATCFTAAANASGKKKRMKKRKRDKRIITINFS